MSDARVGNWIAMCRDVRQHPLVGAGKPVKPADKSRPAWSRFEAWFDVLCLGQFEPTTINNKGAVQVLAVGELMAARGYLAKRWNWHEKTVARWLIALRKARMIAVRDTDETRPESGQQIGQRRSNKCNVITICNYALYQPRFAPSERSERAAKRAASGRGAGGERAQFNKENNSTLKGGTAGADAPPNSEKGSRWPAEKQVPEQWRQEALRKVRATRAQLDICAERFVNHWLAKPGRDGCKLDWEATWRNWYLKDFPPAVSTASANAPDAEQQISRAHKIIAGEEDWNTRIDGPGLYDDGCRFTAPQARALLTPHFDRHNRWVPRAQGNLLPFRGPSPTVTQQASGAAR
jgi:hypothetical protein